MSEEVVNDDDLRLRELWLEYGDDVCNAVKTALSEVNDQYNPSGKGTWCQSCGISRKVGRQR